MAKTDFLFLQYLKLKYLSSAFDMLILMVRNSKAITGTNSTDRDAGMIIYPSFTMSEGDFCASAAQHFQLGSASPFTPSFVSDVESLVLTQTWKVNNFSLLLKLAPPNFCLRSTILKCSSMPGVNWQLCLYPGCRRFDNACNVSLLVRLFTTPPRSEVVIKAECRLLLVGDNDEIKFCNVNTVVFHARPPRKEYLWGSRNIPENTVCEHSYWIPFPYHFAVLFTFNRKDRCKFASSQLKLVRIFKELARFVSPTCD
ncbi:BTB/POZ domain [Parelaphostrongylus tenuis]|uniref:BTB/POZ domain n=1 Tax=Parelaphostrongylus tenuis TaxID=148309 RepID=A0AAD5N2H5_PARTN|nr:BTB/POZ domain [Parelaphostrongylus tenuis]